MKEKIQKKIEQANVDIQDNFVSERTRTTRALTIRTTMTIVVVSFTSLAYFAHNFPYFPFDLMVTKAIQSFHPVWFDLLMKAVSYIGFMPHIGIIVGLFSLIIFFTGLRFESVISIANAFLITLINLVLKDIVNRPRPNIDLVNVFSHLKESSFPSGHVMLYLAYFGYLYFLAYITLKKSFLRTLILVLLSLIILLIGPSRIYLGAHWSSDVIGAYLFSSVWLVLLIYFHNWIKPRFFIDKQVKPKKK